jgi:diguanylate cyclase (GGDEF)-like protein
MPGESVTGSAVDVLVVDDDPNISLLVGETLSAPDRRLHYAHSGAEALRSLRRLTPALILLDVDLGDMSGFEVATLCRANERLAAVPIVFITGRAVDDGSMAAGYGLGAIDYLSKPIVLPVLASKVTALCTLQHQTRVIADQRDQLEAARVGLERANARLARLAATDPLTGLANRRQLEQALIRLRERQQRTAGLLAVMVLDLDGFKFVNDEYGHQAGDQVLTLAAKRMSATMRPYDVVARLGGDEFAIAFGSMEGAHAPASAGQRLKDVLGKPYELVSGVAVQTPASIGIVEVHPDAKASIDAILADADAAMYRSKSDPARPVVCVAVQ